MRQNWGGVMNKRLRTLIIMLGDIIMINFAFLFSIFLHDEGTYRFAMIANYSYIFIAVTFMKIFIFNRFSLYSSLWEYASIEELMKIVMAVLVGNVFGIIYITITDLRLYPGIYVVSIIFEIVMIGGNRFSYRVIRRLKQSKSLFRQNDDQHVLIIGSGSTASLIATEIKSHSFKYGHLIGFISDDASKLGQSIAGTKVVGTRHDIVSISIRHKVTDIILAIPTASKDTNRQIIADCKRTGAKVKIVPGIVEVIDGQVSMNAIRNVEIEDLLGRDTVDLNIEEISSYIEGRTILVTGGGGSIGSELCRQIAKFKPSKLIVLDVYENNAYDIQNELSRDYGNQLDLEVLIASVRDRNNIFRIMNEYKPQVVFHAAAHKHVPLMEKSPKEAVKNNVIGTLNMVEAAHENNVDRFVMISTDKAVNPTSVMGATKRLCELIIQSIAKQSRTKFVGVRFGNVLGSNGSVIPLFKKQIELGGPVTVTHRDIIRYFMTIQEASQLVIEAGGMANGGELFILDMGEPVRIYDLAEDLIRLSGLKPNIDIDIQITGLRPGEKLYEELLMSEEGIQNTRHEKIFIGMPSDVSYKIVKANVEKLEEMLIKATNDEIKERLSVLVPTYKPFGQSEIKVSYTVETPALVSEHRNLITANNLLK